ncbi:hypothetical protein B0H19DRAFT_1276883 [Mycena capillaripes]|nr:hypothetical protein B0H19DRAFT_1276883 [Mycena capillaripes]
MQPFDANNQLARIDAEPFLERAPIHGVPYELLAEIMVLALTARVEKNKYRQDCDFTPSVADVLVLCQVCFFWRQVALNTPQLWVGQRLPLTVWTKAGMFVSSIGTKMFLERSAPFPISVRMEPEGSTLPPTVISAAHRWKSLDITYKPGELDTTGLARIPSGSLKTLEKLWWFKPVGLELDMFLSAPRLCDVTLHVPGISSDIPPIPWAQLTRLHLLYDSPQPCLDILVHCENLVSAKVVTKQWMGPDSAPVGATGLLAHLEELNIEMGIRFTEEHLGPFLRELSLPVLKSLTFSLRVLPGVDEYFISSLTPTLMDFLTRSPNLEYLSMDDCVFAEDVADILRFTPKLITLDLNNTEVNDDFFAALCYSETDATPLAPKLETLSLCDVGESFEEASFTDMIRSRWWSDDELLMMPTLPKVTRLKCATVWNDSEQMPMYLAPEWREKMDLYRLKITTRLSAGMLECRLPGGDRWEAVAGSALPVHREGSLARWELSVSRVEVEGGQMRSKFVGAAMVLQRRRGGPGGGGDAH